MDREVVTPNSCLRTECITDSGALVNEPHYSQLMSPHGMHRTCRLHWSHISSSQLMSPHGMHPLPARCRRYSPTLPTHVSARNASQPKGQDLTFHLLPTHVSARNASHYDRTWIWEIHLPTHVSARNASILRFRTLVP